MNARLESAIKFARMGCSIIPLAPRDKNPFFKLLPNNSWAGYQKRRATEEEIRQWFTAEPNANIGLVCGEISGIVAIDVDGEGGENWFSKNMPMPNLYQNTSSSHKFHAFYKHPMNMRIAPSVKLLHGEIDVRGDGSYVVLAPSIHPSGATYTLHIDENFSGIDSLVALPDIVGDAREPRISQYGQKQISSARYACEGDHIIPQGERNSSLTSECGRWYAKGLTVEDVEALALRWNAIHCETPMPEKEVLTVAHSMAKTHSNRNPQAMNTGAVEHWVQQTAGEWSIVDLYRDLSIVNAEDKIKAQQALKSLVNHAIIEQTGKREGIYRKRNLVRDVIEWNKEEEEKPISMWLPFGLSQMCDIRPKNIILVAGETNAGKTAMLFNVVFINRIKKWNYLTSEMTAGEIRERIRKFGIDEKEWCNFVEFSSCNGNFHDKIDPDGFNIIDFLEVYEDFSKIGSDIKRIFDRLRNGICIIAIQKKRGELFGRGGEFTLEKARLGISLFSHGHLPNAVICSAKITKCKNYKPGKNPDGKEVFFKLEEGYLYSNDKIAGIDGYANMLSYVNEKEREKTISGIQAYCKDIADKNKKNEPEYDFYGQELNSEVF